MRSEHESRSRIKKEYLRSLLHLAFFLQLVDYVVRLVVVHLSEGAACSSSVLHLYLIDVLFEFKISKEKILL